VLKFVKCIPSIPNHFSNTVFGQSAFQIQRLNNGPGLIRARVAGYSAVYLSSDGRQLSPEVNEVLLALQRQTQPGGCLALLAAANRRELVELAFP